MYKRQVYTSGIIPVVPATGEIPEGSVAQAKQALTNLSHLLEAADTSMANVVKTTVFIKEMNDFAAINEVYATFFEGAYPARSCVEAVSYTHLDVYKRQGYRRAETGAGKAGARD